MGFFDKAKNFLSGYGLKVEFTRLEKQDPQYVTFPVTDSVFKGNYKVTAEKDCIVLKHIHKLLLQRTNSNGETNELELSTDIHDETTDIIGADIKWPYPLKGNESKDDGFVLLNVDIPSAITELGYPNIAQAIDDPNLKLICKVVADVKGSPFDPTAETVIKMVQ